MLETVLYLSCDHGLEYSSMAMCSCENHDNNRDLLSFCFPFVSRVAVLFLIPQVPIDGDLLTDGDGLSAAEQVKILPTHTYCGSPPPPFHLLLSLYGQPMQMAFCLSVCLSVCLPVCLYVCQQSVNQPMKHFWRWWCW